MQIEEIKERFEKDIKKVKTLEDINSIFRYYLGKKGKIAALFKSLKNLSPKERKEAGIKLNSLKKEIEKAISKQEKKIKEEKTREILLKEKIDVTRPGEKIESGHLHPLTIVMKEIEEIFATMGFSTVQGPEVETEWYNFDALNIPKYHPARDMWDTFWLKKEKAHSKKSNLLLRTHTSPVQVRFMEKHNPPLRIIVPGKVFRHEATDASHEIQFYQVEGLMVDKEISAAHFKAIIEEFLKRFFKKKIEIRLRPSFFPFTEPSFEIDMRKGGGNWLEIMGAGMVHPNVFKAAGINPKNWQGFAFGMGVERLAMLRYKIDDVRLFYSADLRFLKQF